jgi:hypothetical protein
MLRDGEPKLADSLKHTRVLILAEPGGGKSVVACAAVHQFICNRERILVIAELKGYRGDPTLFIKVPCHLKCWTRPRQ